MTFSFYILYSKTIDQYYVGQSFVVSNRLSEHNSGVSKSTKKARDWVLVYEEHYLSRSSAVVREREIKGKKSRKYIELAHLASASRKHSGRLAVRIRYSPPNHPRVVFSFMTFSVYILYSKSIDQYYVGQSADVVKRLLEHNSGVSKSTKKANDWVLVCEEHYSSRSAAVVREREIKAKKSRKYIEYLISSFG